MVNKNIFDLIENPEIEDEEILGLNLEENPKEFSGLMNFLKNIGKASLEGVQKLGTRFGPLVEPGGETPELSQQKFSRDLEEAIPSEEGGFFQKSLQRGLREAPTNLSIPGGTVLGTLGRQVASSGLEQTAEELGASPLIQAVVGVVPWLTPDLASKVIAKGGEKELYDLGKKYGLTEEQLTPLFQGEKKQQIFSKLAQKRGKAEKILKETKSGLGNIHQELRKSQEAQKFLSPENTEKFKKTIDKTLKDLPSETRKLIEKDYEDLLEKGVNGDELINFWVDINSQFGKSPALGNLKVPIKNAIKELSPELSKDFELTNKLYEKYFKISNKLKPSKASDFFSAGEAGVLAHSVMTGNVAGIAGVIGTEASRQLARELLTNPRLQNLSAKMVKATNENAPRTFINFFNQYKKEIRKTNPDIYEKLDDLDEDEILSIFQSSTE